MGMLVASFADLSEADYVADRWPERLLRPASGLLMWRDKELWPSAEAPLLGMQGEIVDRRTSRLLSTTEVAASLLAQRDAAFADWSAPFRIVWNSNGSISAAADHCGLGHWYVHQRSGMATFSDSAVAIARFFDLHVDELALGGLALTGSMVELDSVIAGVRKLAIGQIACLSEGRLTCRPMPSPSILAAPEDAIAASIALLHSAHPGAEIELSGGWDSRLMLAGIAPGSRQNCTGVTVGDSGHPDVIIATQLATIAGMRHEIFDQSALGRLDSDELLAALENAAERDDFGANPLDRVGLNIINANRECKPRFSGQNGEILRGFYYDGQNLSAPASEKQATRLIHWRIISNDVVGESLFDREWLADMRATTERRLTELLVDSSSNWADAIDRFYLENRMHRWCGTAISAALGRRTVLLPFFDADVLSLARGVPPALKKGSRFAAKEIVRLDPVLASIRLDSGLLPANVARGGLSNQFARARHLARRAKAKVLQRLFSHEFSPVAAETASAAFERHQLQSKIDLHQLSKLGIFSPESLDSISRGNPHKRRANIGFILNTHFLLNIVNNLHHGIRYRPL